MAAASPLPLRVLPLLLVALAISACARDARRGEVAEVLPSASAPPVVVPPPAPPPAAEGGAPRERPKRTGTAGSTRGTVACGEARCKPPGETCLWDEASFAWGCAPVPDVATRDYAPPGYACNDERDCPQGETCCEVWVALGTAHSTCVPRAEVNTRCSAEICTEGGARCPAGRSCTPRPDEQPAFCEAPKGPATCADKKRCPASAPICVSVGGRLTCAAVGTPEYRAAPVESRWECTLQSDCNAGDQCSYSYGDVAEVATFCAMYSQAYRGTFVCEPNGTNPCGRDAACRAAYVCRQAVGGPPWLGTWATKQ